ncbi:hypothetical protein [Lysinibacillus endophyticus]|uniref:hypothetical protein n=1 Tax=Ureibacillus endophyticus TaxID=1978490 RepID=UPI0020A100C2|nr:hypothetical protein [Lysinibacillus endophyticus]MCP1145044.1 hypothetical protein [Lysinibacillus endophyticus]
MYYFYQPQYFHSPYHPMAYRPILQRPNMNHRFVQQPMNQPNPRNQQNPGNQNPYPEVDPNQLYDSANETKKLMKDASIVLERLSSSKDFDKQLMDHAQQSQSEEVKKLIKSIGIESDVDILYTPDSLRLEFISQIADSDCCKLSIVLKWR